MSTEDQQQKLRPRPSKITIEQASRKVLARYPFLLKPWPKEEDAMKISVYDRPDHLTQYYMGARGFFWAAAGIAYIVFAATSLMQ
jgi:hypothetical protein